MSDPTSVPTSDPTSDVTADAAPGAGGVATAGRGPLGTVTFHDRVVSRIAVHAVREVPDAGSPGTRLLGRSIGAQLGTSPKVDVDVDLSVASLEMAISVRWPASVPEVSAAVRARVIERVTTLTGLTITDIRIHVTDLVTATERPPRVR